MINLHGIDNRISEIMREVDFYSYLTPLNQKEEKEKFFSNFKKGARYNPVYKYKDVEFFYQERWLRETRDALDESNDIHRLFIDKIVFIQEQLELIKCTDPQFAVNAVRLYGAPDGECLDIAGNVLSESRERRYEFPEETVPPEEMASVLRKGLEEKGIGWEVVLSRKIVPKITVSSKDRTVYINSAINYTKEEVERLKVHEIEVHVYRGINGEEQPYKIFRDGLAGYDETEEGLAILAEEKAGCLETDTRQMKLYAGRTLAADLCLKVSFYDMFLALREFFPDYLAYRLAERAKRGIEDTSNPGGFPRDYHYISGWPKMRRYVENRGNLSILYIGKIGLRDVGIVKKLLDEGILKPPKYLPGFIVN
ncbi:MAG: tyrosine/phenylalanine carboxypeptidase domain-containing protein [Candidatus Omnitrophota bacterium]